MTEMVERVARQMYEYDFWGERAPKWPSMSETQRGPFLKRARTAIAAMLVPTEGMINRGIYHISFDERCEPQVEREEIAACWRAMIRAVVGSADVPD